MGADSVAPPAPGNFSTAAALICRIVLGGVFLVSGLAKISDQVRFLLTLRAFRFFPDPLVPFAAIVLPWLEFFLGLFVLAGLFLGTSALMIAALNLIFSAALLSVVVRGIEIDCGCFGLVADLLGLPDQADLKAVVRNVVFAAMGIYLFLAPSAAWTLEDHLCSRRGARDGRAPG
jgi:uncharacterized membrane protein YphA (DoxX/SURF4 family)